MANIRTVGVVGAGQMGNGIAHVCALAGYEVVLHDSNPDALAKGLGVIEANMRRQVARQLITADDMVSGMQRIRTAGALSEFAGVDLAIEAATEREAVKTAIFRDLCAVVPQRAIIATNTSSLSITRLASTTDRPERFVGLHFMNPVPVMQLVEIIRGLATDQDTYETALELAARLKKTVANAEDYPAFIVNRILMPMINEAVYTLFEGVGTVEGIDTAMKLGANHPMGPLALADFIGLDTCLSIMQVLHDGLADTKYRPCPLLVKYVEAGWVGRKVGRGFYNYEGERPVPTR